MNQKNDTPTPAGLTPEQAHAYHERAGIMEYDGHLPRQMAEAVALAGVRRANPCVLPPAAPAGREQRVVGGP